MNLLIIAIIIIVTLILFETSKHLFLRSFSKIILMVFVLLAVFFIIIATLQSQNNLETDNPIIKTGAAIVDTINEQEFMGDLKDKFEDVKEDVNDKLT